MPPGKKLYTKEVNVNFRKQSDAPDGTQKMPAGQEVTLVDAEAWYRVTKDGQQGWIRSDFLTESGPQTFVTRPNSSAKPFLVLPLQGTDRTGKPLTPYTAKIVAVLDHSGTSIDATVSTQLQWGLRAKDKKVRAFNGEVGDTTPTASPPFGYTKSTPGPFFSKGEINYIGCDDPKDKHAASWYLNYDGHCGYDFSYPEGTPILAPADGELRKAQTDPINGTNKKATAWEGFHTFYIDHKNGFLTWYLHATRLESALEEQLQKTSAVAVKRGQVVGYVGKVGAAGVHLHFEVRDKDHRIFDPYADKLWIA